MAPTPGSDWRHLDYNVNQYLKSTASFLYIVFWYIGLFVLTNLCIILLLLTWRLLKVKFGRRIKPDRRKAIMITGATAGIGLALTKHFYKLGFSVIAGYFNDQEPGYIELLEYGSKPYESICKKKGRNIQAPRLFLVRMDVRSIESISNSAQEIHTLLDKNDIELHFLINNAGVSRDGPFEWCSRQSIKDLIDTNLTGTMMVTREFILNIVLNKGRIINVSSGVYVTPGPTISVYGSSKSAIAYFTGSLNRDLERYGASSVAVMPGNFIATSSIIYPRVRCLQESEKTLSEKERSVYRKSIEEYTATTHRYLRKKLEESGDDPDQVSKIFKIDIPDFTNLEKNSGCLDKLIRWLVRQLDGSVSTGQTLENSGILDGYETAVCLKNPPRNIYAGSPYYTNFSGPSLEYLPRVASDLLTWLFTKGLEID